MIRTRTSRLPVLDCCRLLGVSRATVYRTPRVRAVASTAELERVAELHPRFGYRRLAVVLGTSSKPVRTQMQRLGIMARRRHRRVRTTFPVPIEAPNLCRPARVAGELLVSDFTYIPLQRGFAYFAVTLDAFTRRVRGYHLSAKMDAQMPLLALEMALESGPLVPGWIHHSDRGCQYASSAFRRKVTEFGGTPSFSNPASPQENAFAESFFARFKDEAIRTEEIQTLCQAQIAVDAYVEFYNRKRPHSSLGYQSPLTFESKLNEGAFQ